MLTKSQQLMVADGFPAILFQTREQRAAWWANHPDLGTIPTLSFKDDPKDDKFREMREQLERETTARRIQKLLGGQARKATMIRKSAIRGMRWDPRHNKWVPIDPPESRMKYDDPKSPADDQATVSDDSKSSVAANEDTMTKAPKKTRKAMIAKKTAIKKAAKKTVKAAKSKSTNGSGEKKGPGVIATIVATIGRASGATAEELLEILVSKFPDREADGMMKTIRIQANKNAHHKDKTEKRGLIYYGSK